jgi:hypothetical protein
MQKPGIPPFRKKKSVSIHNLIGTLELVFISLMQHMHHDLPNKSECYCGISFDWKEQEQTQ